MTEVLWKLLIVFGGAFTVWFAVELLLAAVAQFARWISRNMTRPRN